MKSNQINSSELKTKSVLFVIFLIGFLLRLYIAWQPVKVLIEKHLPDDSFYYFIIAHNFAQNGLISFDNINLTNGFHPLWLFVILPIYKFISPLIDLQVHLSLTLACIFELFTFYFIYRIVYRFSQRRDIGVLSILYYALNPTVIFQTTNGLETAIEMFVLSLFVWFFIEWNQNEQVYKYAIIFGVVAGLLFLARSDTIFFIIVFYCIAALSWGIFKFWKQIIVSGLAALLMVAPWLIWNYYTFGSIFQVSGIAVPHAIYQRFLLSNVGATRYEFFVEGIKQLLNLNFWARGDPIGLPFLIGILLWFFIIISLIQTRNRREMKTYRLIILGLMISGICLVVVHAGFRWYPRPWYFTPTAFTFAIGFSMIFSKTSFKNQLLGIINIVVIIYFLASGYLFWNIGFYPWQKEMYAAAFWLKDNIPNDKIVGSFNAGIYSFYSDKNIINLDGVVNNAAFEAIKQKNILNYLEKNNVEYVIDYDSAIKKEYAPFMGSEYPHNLKEIHILGGTPDSELGLLRLYRVTGSP